MFITGCDGIFENPEDQQAYDAFKELCRKGIDKLQEFFVTAIQSQLKTHDKHYLMMYSFLEQTKAQIKLFNEVMLPMLFELKEYSIKNLLEYRNLQPPLFYALSILEGNQELQKQYEHFYSYTFNQIRLDLIHTYKIKDEKLLSGFQACRIKYQILLDNAHAFRKVHVEQCNALPRDEQELFSARWNQICHLINDKLYPLSLEINEMEHFIQIGKYQFFKPEDALHLLKKKKEQFEKEFTVLFTDYEQEFSSSKTFP